MPAFRDQSPAYKIASWVLIGTFVICAIVVFVAMMMYLNAGLKLKNKQQLGRRIEENCGKEVTEKETERYFINQEFEENNLNKQITSAVIIGQVMLGVMLVLIGVAYFFWTYMILHGTKDSVGNIIIPKFVLEKLGKATPWLGWFLFLCLIAVLSYGASTSWIKANLSIKLKTDTIFSDSADETEMLNELKDKLPKPKILEYPWFPIAAAVAYGVGWSWITTLDTTGTRVESRGALALGAVVLLYVFASVLVWFAVQDVRELFVANASYHKKSQALQNEIQNSVTNTVTRDKIKAYFKSWIETLTPNTEVEVDSDLVSGGKYYPYLWKYIQHRSGKEMQEFYNDSNNTLIDPIRRAAMRMRMTREPMRKASQRFCRKAIIAPTILIVLFAFTVFNLLTRIWSATKMVIGSLMLIFILTILSTGFGWFSNALLL